MVAVTTKQGWKAMRQNESTGRQGQRKGSSRRHRWERTAGRVASDVDRWVCVDCGVVKIGFRAVRYWRNGMMFQRAPECAQSESQAVVAG